MKPAQHKALRVFCCLLLIVMRIAHGCILCFWSICYGFLCWNASGDGSVSLHKISLLAEKSWIYVVLAFLYSDEIVKARHALIPTY
jgi:hypothetical protein